MSGLIRLGAWAAIAGGALRIADSFTQGVLSPAMLAALYLATDVLLLIGVAALWLRQRATLDIAGKAGLAIFVLGIVLVRAAALGFGRYQTGATVAVLGLALYAIEALLAKRGQPWAPVAWLVSLAAGVAGAFGVAPEAMLALAGVAFGAGFIAAGVECLAA